MPDRTYLETTYKLKENPFADRVSPKFEMVGRVEERKRWTSIVESRKGTSANTMCFITGSYGSGKTLSLYNIVKQYESDPVILPIFIKMLPEDKVTKFGVDFIQRIFKKVPRQVYERFSLQDLKALEQNYPGPAKLFGRIVLKDDKCIDFLSGQKVFSDTELNKLRIRKIDKTDSAKEYLLSFLFLLKGIGINTLLIAVDETEYVFSQMGNAGAAISSVWNTLRELYDLQSSQSMEPLPAQPANMIFFFAISSSGWELLNNLGKREAARPGPVQPLLRRIQSEQIQLLPLTLEEAEKLIETRLKQNRVGKIEDKPLIPFDESFVKYVYDLSNGGNPSEILRFCDTALLEGLNQKIKILNKAFAEQAFIIHALIVDTTVK